MHTERTQYAHTQHREQNTRYNNNMQHIEDNTSQGTEQHTENSTHISPAQDNAQPQRTFMHTYSLDYYNEYVAIKDSNTIELYTISKENI